MKEFTPRGKASNSEKITINLGYVDLGQIDLLVQEGFFSNRTDFIRNAIRAQLAGHSDVIRNSVTRNTLDLGLRVFTRRDLERAVASGEKLRIRVLGLATIAEDVGPDLSSQAIESITVLGVLHASKDVRTALAGRIR